MSKHSFSRLALAAGLLGALAPSHGALAQAESEEHCRAGDGADGLPSTEDDTFECGRGADASGDGAAAVGTQASATRPGTTAVGRAAGATADLSTAIGSGATADYVSSVALGAGSVADTEDSVSVGNATLKRRITNVAEGVASSDVATLGQLTAAVAGVASPVDLIVSNSIAIDDVTTRAIPTNLNGFTVPANIGQIYIGNTTQSADAITIDSGANFPGGISFRRYLGTAGSPQPVTVGTQLGYLDFRGYNEGFFYNAASLDVVVDGTFVDAGGLMPTKMRFSVSDGQQVAVAMELLSNGRLELNAAGNPVGALGDPRFYVFQDKSDWNTVLSSNAPGGASYVIRLHSAGESAGDYLIGGSSGAGTGTFKFSVRGNGDTYIAGDLLVQGRDVLAELTALAGTRGGQDERIAFGSAGAAIASGEQALAIGGGANAQASGAIAIGYAGGAASTSSLAVGTGATVDANAARSVALGAGSRVAPGAANALAVGSQSSAQASGATALGADAAATSQSSIALGQNAIATGTNAAALGANTRANGADALAMGAGALAASANAAAIGGTAQATAAGATALGAGAKAIRGDAVAVGSNNIAQGAKAIALGSGAVAVADRASALGTGAVVTHEGSTAVGAGARTTAANQVMLGAGGTAVVVADIASSTAAQQGPVDAVTIDGAGVLGRQRVASAQSVADVRSTVDHIAAVSDAQFTSLSNDVAALGARLGALEQNVVLLDERIASSTAVAVAMSGASFLPDQRFNLTANLGTYDGAHAGSFQIGALVNEHVALNAGIATGFNKQGKTAGRVGVTLGW